MGLNWAEHTEEIAASIDECFDAITDYESFPKWQNAVLATEVVERDRKKLGEVVRFEIDGKVRKVHYTLRYHYDRPERIWWDFVEGRGVKEIEGEYVFEKRGDRTAATYRLGIDPGGGVPGPVGRRIGKQLVKRSVEDLKVEAEKRAGARTAEQPIAESEESRSPFDALPGVVGEVARLPGRILVGIGRRLGG
jgi:ribosome-associated toxin RatA of RatAB toxin-antitoxin module